MLRLKNYIILFGINLVIFVLFHFIGFIDTIVLLCFILGTIGLIFTREAKPEPTKGLKNPKVHYYQRSRINYYGYMLVGAASGASLIFYYSTLRTNIRVGLLALVLWAILIVATFLVIRYEEKALLKLLLSDFVYNYVDFKIPVRDVDLMTINILMLKKFSKKNVKEIVKQTVKDGKLDEKVSEAYVKYLDIIDDEELVSEEIAQYNKSS